MPYPDSLTGWVDGVTELDAYWFNAIEAYLGIIDSLNVDSITYKLTNSESVSPGHKHEVADLFDGDDGDVLWVDPDDSVWKHVTPDIAGLVAKTGDQTIVGVKTFSSIPVGPASNPESDNQLTRKKYVVDQIALAVAAIISTYHLTTTTTTTSTTSTTSTSTTTTSSTTTTTT